MAQSLTHTSLFSTKNREPWLSAEVSERLYRYLAGALNNQESTATKVEGHIDHIQMLYRVSKNKILAALQAASSAGSQSQG